jgi:hypothetical protein
MSKNNENNPISVSIHLGSLTTDGAVVPVMYVPKKAKLVSAHILDGAGVAADNSNYVVLTLKNGSTAVASLDTRAAHEGALTANVAKAMTVDEDEQEMASASSMSLLYNETGTVALTDAKLVLTYFPF